MEGSDQHLGKHKRDRGLGQGYHFNRRLMCSCVDVSLTFFPLPQRLMITLPHLFWVGRWKMKSDCFYLFLHIVFIP